MKTQGLGRGLSALISSADDTKAPVKKIETEIVKEKEIPSVKKKYSSNKVLPEKIVTKSNNISQKPKSEKAVLEGNAEYRYISINRIEVNPYQPRKEFDENAIEELAQAISKSGFITPILVNQTIYPDKFVLVAGERRLRACKRLGLAEIPAVIKDLTDAQMMQIAIIENVQRKNLNPIEEAKAFLNMQELLGHKSEEIAEAIGLPAYYVVQKLKLTKLPEAVQRYVSNGELSEGAGIALLKLDSEDAMIAAAKIAIRQHMSRVSVEKLVEKILQSKGLTSKDPNIGIRNRYQFFTDAVKDTLGWNLKIKGGAAGKGKIEIEFLDEMELNNIYKKLERILK